MNSLETKIQITPLVSVIIPVCNGEKYLEESIASITDQTYKNLEIIILDDGSKDNTYKAVQTAYQNNPNVTIYTKENGGKASALNFRIQKSKYDFIVCIDADTLLNKGAIRNLMIGFENEEVAAIAGTVKV